MKVLFVEQNDELQAKWIEPLRKKGWGVVRARSAEDATRMMELHAEALEAIVVGERFVAFAEKQSFPYVVLTSTWKENDILKHQNSAAPAMAYLAFNQNIDQLCSIFETSMVDIPLKATGTEGISIPQSKKGLALEDYSEVLTRPEPTSTGTFGLQLSAPTIYLGGKEAKPLTEAQAAAPLEIAPVQEIPEVQEISFDDSAKEEPVFQSTAHGHGTTRILDSTDLAMEANGLDDIGDLNPGPGDEILEGLDSLDLDALTFGEPPPPPMPSYAPLVEEEEVYTPPAALSPPPPPVQARTQQNYAPATSSISQFSVNPAPSAQISDSETLRSYLALREQDVAVLTGQVRSSQQHMHQLETLLKMEKARNTELTHLASKQEQQIKNYDREKQVEFEVIGRQVEDLEIQLKDRKEKTRAIEMKLRLTVEEINKIKERVRVDIRRIRVRERELEGQLEVLKKDSAALLQARDDKILELKRKVDLLEFNMELVQEQFNKEKQTATDLKTKLKDAAHVVKQVGGLLA